MISVWGVCVISVRACSTPKVSLTFPNVPFPRTLSISKSSIVYRVKSKPTLYREHPLIVNPGDTQLIVNLMLG